MVVGRGYRELLRYRRFVLYELSASAAGVGYSVYAISVPWLAWDLSGSFLLVGAVLFVEYGVYTATFLLAPWVDRARDKRTIFLVCYPAQAAVALALGGALADHMLSTPVLVGGVALLSLLWDFVWAASNVVPPLLLPADQLFRAQGLSGLLGGATQVAGFAAGGILLVVVGPSGGLVLYGLFLGLGAVVAAFVALPAREPVAPLSRYWSEFRAGWRRFSPAAERSLLGLGSTELLRGVFTSAPAFLITLLAVRVLVEGPGAYATLFVAWVGGGTVAGIVLGELNPRRKVGRLLIGSALAEAALFVPAVALAGWPVASALLWAGIGAAGTAYLTGIYAFLRGAFPSGEVGRISSNLYVFAGISSAAGAIVLGPLAARLDPTEFALLVGGGCAALAGLVLALPSVRSLAF